MFRQMLTTETGWCNCLPNQSSF